MLLHNLIHIVEDEAILKKIKDADVSKKEKEDKKEDLNTEKQKKEETEEDEDEEEDKNKPMHDDDGNEVVFYYHYFDKMMRSIPTKEVSSIPKKNPLLASFIQDYNFNVTSNDDIESIFDFLTYLNAFTFGQCITYALHGNNLKIVLQVINFSE